MAYTTTQLRVLWSPVCSGPWARVALWGEGVVTVRATIVDAVKALDKCLMKHQYETRKADTGAYNCRAITGGTAYSLHAYGIALDINWLTNPYGPALITDMPMGMVRDILAIRTNSGHQVWGWGGLYSGNKDAMHFEIVCSPAQLATGIKYPIGTEIIMAAPVGNIDIWEPTLDGRIHVAGWAFDPDAKGDEISIHIHVWDSGHGPQITTLRTTVSRPDVNAVYGLSGNHGFDGIADPPQVFRDPTAIVYGIDANGGGQNAEIGRQTVRVMR